MGREKLTGPATQYVAEELRAQRARLKLTYADVETATGLSRMTVLRALSGDAAIAIETAIRLCDAFGLDVGLLIDRAALHARQQTQDPPTLSAVAANRDDELTERQQLDLAHPADESL